MLLTTAPLPTANRAGGGESRGTRSATEHSHTALPCALVVEDDPEVARMLSRALVGDGFTVKLAGTGVDALEFIRSGPIDVIVLDFTLPPGVSSWQVLERLRVERIDTPVLVYTGTGSEAIHTELVRHGVNAYLSKPARPAVLLDHLRRLVGQRLRAADPEIAARDAALRAEEFQRIGVEACVATLVRDVVEWAHSRGADAADFGAQRSRLFSAAIDLLLDQDLAIPLWFLGARAVAALCASSAQAVRHASTLAPLHAAISRASGSEHPVVAAGIERLTRIGRSDSHRSEEHLARALQVSRSSLSRMFRRHTGLSFREWTWVIPVRQAVSLFFEGESSIKVIAGSCGFRHSGTFTREFQRVFGLSPRAFRQFITAVQRPR